MKRWLKRGFLILIAGGIVGLIVLSMQPKPVEVDLAIIERGPLEVAVEEDGETRIREKYLISAPLAGRLLRIDLEEGDSVIAHTSQSAGKPTVVARLLPTDPMLLDDRAIAEAEAAADAAAKKVEQVRGESAKLQAALEQAKANKERAQAEVNYEEKEHERLKGLYDRSRSVSEQEVSSAFFRMQRAKKELLAAGFAVEAARAEIKSAELAVRVAEAERRRAEAALLRTKPNGEGDEEPLKLYSPHTGKVLRVLQESETVVMAGKELIEVGDLENLEVVADVLTTDAVKIREGMPVELKRWGGDQPLKGFVDRKSPSGYTKTSPLGVEEQRLDIFIRIETPFEDRETLHDGFRVVARVILWKGEDVLKVPNSALARVDRKRVVFVMEGEQAVQREVTIGREGERESEVLEGLNEGEKVILHPSDKINDGALIAPRGSQ